MTTTLRRKFAKVVVAFERRNDGGLRAYSNDVPGFVLSHSDPTAVIRDVGPALEVILSAMWGVKVKASMLPQVGEEIEEDEIKSPEHIAMYANHARDYLAQVL